ncbi:MAG: hypothetical protein HeimC2_06840 [Candidatus Heimdallarchaeota archaeon LC_2]|nr:MAG: hypothetical protein HeimC2_06840 [Candidatus Heimdallarchaeota archaeon LC_2]
MNLLLYVVIASDSETLSDIGFSLMKSLKRALASANGLLTKSIAI